MSILAEARFWIARAAGLGRRGWASLRTRGLAASWQRLKLQFRRSAVPTQALYAPGATPFAAFALRTSDAPRASIVIPIHGAFAHTLACLRTVAAHPPRTAFEVIVVDDASPDDSLAKLSHIDGIRIVARESNGGFINACNDGAAQARGEFLVFLNNDTVPQPGWLDALLNTFDAHERVGLVGAKLVYPDGRLQEAGGVVFADIARRLPLHLPARLRLRQRCCDRDPARVVRNARRLRCALRTGLLRRHRPCLHRARSGVARAVPTGRRREGATSGTDVSHGPKAAQVRNQPVFAHKWRDALRTQLPAGTIPTPALLHRDRPQVLIVDALTPQPDRDSGSLRLVNLMRLLIAEGAHVVFLPANCNADGAYTAALQRLGVECWHTPHMAGIPAWLREHGPRFDAAMVSRHYVASEFLPLLRKHAPQARLLFDTVDLHYLRERRAAELSGNAAALRAARRTRELELGLIANADATLVVSEVERELLAQDAPQAAVRVLSNLHDIAMPGPGWAQRKDLLFVGGFRHPPNVDAVLWFAHDVFPQIRAALPGVQCHCIGGDMPAEVRALSRIDGIHILGHVPDLQPWLDGCRVSIAPLRYGAGVKGKVNQAMAHGLPVVATTPAVEGMHLVDGLDVLVADAVDAFADAVLCLHGDEVLWNRIASNGRDNVARHFSPDAARATVREMFLSGPRTP